jgi:hypothetical protein
MHDDAQYHDDAKKKKNKQILILGIFSGRYNRHH